MVNPINLTMLLMILPEALANRRSWIGVKIAVKLAGAGLFDHISETVASGVFAMALSNLMDDLAERTVEKYIERDQSQVKSKVLTAPLSTTRPKSRGVLRRRRIL
jgi:hypothetical protein